jgi:hypothetical protein
MWKDKELSYHLLDSQSRLRKSILEQSKHRSLQMSEIIGMLLLLTRSQSYCMNIRTCFRPISLI